MTDNPVPGDASPSRDTAEAVGLPVGVSDALVAVLDGLDEGVYAVDRSRRVTFWSRGAERITGFAAEEVVGRHCFANLLNHVDAAGRSLCRTRCPVADAMDDGSVRKDSIFLRHRQGHRVAVNVRAVPYSEGSAGVTGAIETFAEASTLATVLREAQELRRTAAVDSLTGLPNRSSCELVISEQLTAAQRPGRAVGLLVVDVDTFKTINDRFGHHVGDEAIRVVANTLLSGARADDFVGRWGGDEFVVVMTSVTPTTLRAAGNRLRGLVRSAALRTDGSDERLTISVGGAVAGELDTTDALFLRADGALRLAKASGRDQVRLDGDEAA